jgi:hypothetical protein
MRALNSAYRARSSSRSALGLLVPEPVRMGASAFIAADQRALGRGAAELVTVDENGIELARELIPEEPGLVLQVVHFVDLDDGCRITTESLGEMSLSVSGQCTPDELRDEVREFIFEDDLRDVAHAPADGPRWADMASALQVHGIVADDETLLALPFLVELDDDVVAALDGQ